MLKQAETATHATRGEMPGRPLRVLGVDPELGFAGGQSQVLGLTLALIRFGHSAELACDPRGKLLRRATEAGVRCHPLAIRNALDFAAALRLRRMVARGGYDVVHFHTSRAHSMAPMVRLGYAGAMVATRRMDYVPNRVFAPYLYNHAVDGVAAISTGVADALASAGVDRNRITIIPSGVDCERFRPASPPEREAARARLGIGASEIAAGTIGMLEERKGQVYLLEAIARLARAKDLPRIVVLIAGEGSLREQLTERARQFEISNRVMLLGLIEDARSLLDALDIFVLPSLKEGLGIALLEAMASGIAAIGSRTGGILDVVEDGRTGLLVTPGDSTGLAEAIGRLACDAHTRATLGGAGRSRICEGFSLEAMARKTAALYHACLAARAIEGRER